MEGTSTLLREFRENMRLQFNSLRDAITPQITKKTASRYSGNVCDK